MDVDKAATSRQSHVLASWVISGTTKFIYTPIMHWFKYLGNLVMKISSATSSLKRVQFSTVNTPHDKPNSVHILWHEQIVVRNFS